MNKWCFRNALRVKVLLYKPGVLGLEILVLKVKLDIAKVDITYFVVGGIERNGVAILLFLGGEETATLVALVNVQLVESSGCFDLRSFDFLGRLNVLFTLVIARRIDLGF